MTESSNLSTGSECINKIGLLKSVQGLELLLVGLME